MVDRAVFILAAGRGKRWIGKGVGEWPTIPKQLLTLGGETLIGRTVNMVNQHGYTPIIVTHSPVIRASLDGRQVKFLNPAGRRWLIESLQSTRAYWRTFNAVLWSDVIYSPAVLDAMLDDESSIKFYGKWGDGCGLVWRGDNPRIDAGMAAVIQHAEAHGPDIDNYSVGRSWELYRWFWGWDLNVHVGPNEHNQYYYRVPDDDYTCDIDKPADWEQAQRKFAEHYA